MDRRRCLSCSDLFTTLVALLAVLPCRAAPPNVFPGAQWTEATPESQGVDREKLCEAAELLARTVGADGARELVVIRHGRMIWSGDDIDKRHGVWSATKSFTSTVLGLLIADGKCTLDTRAADVLPELKAHYPAVTLRHFTTMTSGYRAVGDETTGSYKHGPSKTPFVPKPDGSRKFPAAPQGMFWASGHNNNKCFVIPEWDMVIVRLGLDGKAKDDVWNGFFAKVAEAIRGSARP